MLWPAAMYLRSGRLLHQIEGYSGARRPAEALSKSVGGGSRRHWGKHGHSYRQGPVLGDVQGAGIAGIGAARRARRALAAAANEIVGRDGASLCTKAEYQTLYDLLVAQVSPALPVKLRLLDEAGRPTAAARTIEDYIGALLGKPESSERTCTCFMSLDSVQDAVC